MPANALHLIAACLAMVMLTFVVGGLLLLARVGEMRSKRIHPQSASTSVQVAAGLENVRASDNFRNLFEVPVLFYALAAVALATRHVPAWLALGAWLYVLLRVVHSLIHCTYNKVFHRLTAFMASFALVVGLWVAFFVSIAAAAAQG